MMITGNEPISPTGYNQTGTGLTKREYFAGLAMQGYMSAANPNTKKTPEEWLEEPIRVAQWAVRYSDALIAELNKTEK